MQFEIDDDVLADPDVGLGRKIITAIEESLNCDLTNAELAGILGTSVKTVGVWRRDLTGKRVVKPHYPESEILCRTLAELVERNGSKKPVVTETWLLEADLLQRSDGKSPEQIARAIVWSQNDSFWRQNVRSMPALRKHYDRMRLAAMRDAGNNNDALQDYARRKGLDGR